jgi:tripartite-type tricarboxylate transporter receptor subunit TctC
VVLSSAGGQLTDPAPRRDASFFRSGYMSARRWVIAATSIALALPFSKTRADDFPTRPVRVLAGEVGGGADVAARMLTDAMSIGLGQPVVVDNRPSALAGDTIAKASPDGYTLAITGSVAWITPLLQKASYDPVKDFAAITLATETPLVLLVHPSVPASSVKDLIQMAREKPGVLNYASGPVGGSAHLGAELFKYMTQTNIVRVPYKGTGPGLNALMGGEVQVMINNAGPAIPQVRAGRLKALAVTSAKPTPLLPGLPTVAESVPGYEFTAIFGLFTRAGTPAPVVNRLNKEIVAALSQPQVKERFFKDGSEVVGSSAVEFATTIKDQYTELGKVIQAAGIHQD